MQRFFLKSTLKLLPYKLTRSPTGYWKYPSILSTHDTSYTNIVRTCDNRFLAAYPASTMSGGGRLSNLKRLCWCVSSTPSYLAYLSKLQYRIAQVVDTCPSAPQLKLVNFSMTPILYFDLRYKFRASLLL